MPIESHGPLKAENLFQQQHGGGRDAMKGRIQRDSKCKNEAMLCCELENGWGNETGMQVALRSREKFLADSQQGHGDSALQSLGTAFCQQPERA